MKLITKRLILRPVDKKDASDVVENVNNINVSKYLAVVPYPYSKKNAYSWITRKKKNNDFSFVIAQKKDNRVIGAIGLHKLDNDVKKAEIGYWLGEKHWGNHIMSEAVDAILKLGFNKLKLNRIDAKVFAENTPSAKLLLKFGFQKEGYLKQSGYSKAANKVYDDVVYALLKSEYKKFKVKQQMYPKKKAK